MNKPKWLELIWLMCWMMPPIVTAFVVCQHLRMNITAYVAVSLTFMVGWLGLILVWFWMSSSTTVDKNDPEEGS